MGMTHYAKFSSLNLDILKFKKWSSLLIQSFKLVVVYFNVTKSRTEGGVFKIGIAFKVNSGKWTLSGMEVQGPWPAWGGADTSPHQPEFNCEGLI